MLNRYLVFGFGVPLLVDAVSPEVAEAYVLESVTPAADVAHVWTRKIGEVPCA